MGIGATTWQLLAYGSAIPFALPCLAWVEKFGHLLVFIGRWKKHGVV